MARRAGLAVLVLLVVAACSSSQATHVSSSSSAPAQTFVGGCSDTVLTDAEPPAWAQGGWQVETGAPWPVPWAFGTQHTFVAFLFSTRLVAGPSPRVDGTNNKILWVTKDSPPAANAVVVGSPVGESLPVITFPDGPSIVDLPLPGCWAFHPSWSTKGQPVSSIDLEVLPAGTMP